LWIVWVAILVGQLVIGGVAFVVIEGGGGGMPGLGSPLLIPLIAMAGLLGLVAAAVHLVLNSEDKIRETARALRAQGASFEATKAKLYLSYQQKMIMGLALGEGVTIFGFILAFLRQISLNTFLIFLSLGILLHLAGTPKAGTLHRVLLEEYPLSIH